MGNTTISLRQCICDSRPPTSLNLVFTSNMMGSMSAFLSVGPPCGIADCLRKKIISVKTSVLCKLLGKNISQIFIL